jgi:hypothetical protein
MTPALQKMVEAMEAEIARQCEEHDLQFEGTTDLEKVARAGLEAIKEPGEEVIAVADDADVFWVHVGDKAPGTPEEVWSAMLAEILKETP